LYHRGHWRNYKCFIAIYFGNNEISITKDSNKKKLFRTLVKTFLSYFLINQNVLLEDSISIIVVFYNKNKIKKVFMGNLFYETGKHSFILLLESSEFTSALVYLVCRRNYGNLNSQPTLNWDLEWRTNNRYSLSAAFEKEAMNQCTNSTSYMLLHSHL
jgi:hypothetical protein